MSLISALVVSKFAHLIGLARPHSVKMVFLELDNDLAQNYEKLA